MPCLQVRIDNDNPNHTVLIIDSANRPGTLVEVSMLAYMFVKVHKCSRKHAMLQHGDLHALDLKVSDVLKPYKALLSVRAGTALHIAWLACRTAVWCFCRWSNASLSWASA